MNTDINIAVMINRQIAVTKLLNFVFFVNRAFSKNVTHQKLTYETMFAVEIFLKRFRWILQDVMLLYVVFF